MFETLTFLILLLTINAMLCEVNSIRGVSMQLLPLYDPLKNFTCLDGSVTIPFSYVNDDYCDCPDGTDEPGSSACRNGIFHCSNKGFIPKNIPSGFVNDGFCDCCDTSDEEGYANCTNNCEQLALEAKILAEEISQRFIEGSKIRAHMIESAKKILEGKQLRISNLQILKNKAVILKEEAEAIKNEAEFEETSALAKSSSTEEAITNTVNFTKEHFEEIGISNTFFSSFDTDNNRLLQIDELKAIKIFDRNFDGDISNEELSLDNELVSLPVKFEVFQIYLWPRIKTLMTQKKRKEFRQKLDLLKGIDSLDSRSSEEKANIKENEEFEGAELTETYNGAGLDEHTAKVVEAANDARKQFGKAENALLDLERELANLERVLSKDYGEENEFAPLEGQCFEHTLRDYTYRFCPFSLVVQVGKSGDPEIRLGSWAGWVGDHYGEMLYDRGQYCYNGPQRSTRVMLTCGLTDEVIRVTEPNKCEYVIQFQTPAACRLDKKPTAVHEEL